MKHLMISLLLAASLITMSTMEAGAIAFLFISLSFHVRSTAHRSCGTPGAPPDAQYTLR
jgi:hypothetical protein